MMRGAIFALLLAGQAAWAEAPSQSLVPPARPASGPAAIQTPLSTPAPADPIEQLLDNILRPEKRPTDTQVVQRTAAASSSITALAVARSRIPPERPQNLQRRNTVQRTGLATLFEAGQARTTARGSVCGVDTIKGVKLQPIPGRVKGCGVAEPVKVVSVAGVALDQPMTTECSTAVALDTWVRYTVIPTVGRLGGGVAGLDIMASYACRSRNNQKGAKISEHGRGRAVDVGGIILKNGETLTVLDDWSSRHGAIMKTLHKQACGNFGTVLGPESDRFHKNHFHFDTAAYRSGAYCR